MLCRGLANISISVKLATLAGQRNHDVATRRYPALNRDQQRQRHRSQNEGSHFKSLNHREIRFLRGIMTLMTGVWLATSICVIARFPVFPSMQCGKLPHSRTLRKTMTTEEYGIARLITTVPTLRDGASPIPTPMQQLADLYPEGAQCSTDYRDRPLGGQHARSV